MSHAPLAVVASPTAEHRPDGLVRIDDPEETRLVFEALHDADCREILRTTTEEAHTASELSERCDLPLSTAYRKLDLLTRAGLLTDRTRICPAGKHTTEYRRAVEDVVISIDAETGIDVRVSPREPAQHQFVRR